MPGGQFNRHKLLPENLPEIFYSYCLGEKNLGQVFGQQWQEQVEFFLLFFCEMAIKVSHIRGNF